MSSCTISLCEANHRAAIDFLGSAGWLAGWAMSWQHFAQGGKMSWQIGGAPYARSWSSGLFICRSSRVHSAFFKACCSIASGAALKLQTFSVH